MANDAGSKLMDWRVYAALSLADLIILIVLLAMGETNVGVFVGLVVVFAILAGRSFARRGRQRR